ncbi:hypothetical protein, partial [Proteus terrae]|uniref:hypothetical protein n=1 Tax=Proteus terrae TaxID=1574161 RepID=UPI00301CFC30
IAISSDCPVKKQKMIENKTKLRQVSYSEVVNEKSFPSLHKLSPNDQIKQLLKSDVFTDILVKTIVKLVTINKNNESPI